MPITPLHLGPGLLFKALLPRHLSLLAFAAVQVVIDLEPLWYLLHGDWPIHRALHTFPGATVATVPALLLVIGLPRALRAAWDRRMDAERLPGWRIGARRAWPALVAGALAGAWSHVLLDALMHPDLALLAPFAVGNPLLGALSLAALNAGCVLAGIVGLAWLVVTARRG